MGSHQGLVALAYDPLIQIGWCVCEERVELENTDGAIRKCQSKKDRQHNGQKKQEKQKSVSTTTKPYRLNNMYPTKHGVKSFALEG